MITTVGVLAYKGRFGNLYILIFAIFTFCLMQAWTLWYFPKFVTSPPSLLIALSGNVRVTEVDQVPLGPEGDTNSEDTSSVSVTPVTIGSNESLNIIPEEDGTQDLKLKKRTKMIAKFYCYLVNIILTVSIVCLSYRYLIWRIQPLEIIVVIHG